MENVLTAVKLALRLTENDFDAQILDLINAALLDMGIAGVTSGNLSDPLIKQAVVTYCRLNFGEPDDYDKLKRSYDEQKAQLATATGYTDFSGVK